MHAPSPDTTLVVLLGASDYPNAPKLSNTSFATSANGVASYFLDKKKGYGLEDSNILNLFNSPSSSVELGERIRQFLKAAPKRLAPKKPSDLIVYYIGHGQFDERTYLLSLKASQPEAAETYYRFRDLHQAIKSEARHLRKFFILDSCFSAAAMREMMSESAPTQLMINEVRTGSAGDEPSKGTALLCAASADDVASAPADQPHTMFSGAFLAALAPGDGSVRALTLHQLEASIVDIIKRKFKDFAVRPAAHSPDKSQGDIADVELFPVRRSSDAGSFAHDGIRYALDGSSFEDREVLHCLVVTPELAIEETATPLVHHVRRAFANYGEEILSTAATYRARYRGPALKRAEPAILDLPVVRALESEETLRKTVEALCKADVAVFDLTDFEPGVLFLLGVRSVARRGVTIASVGGKYTIGNALPVPFNLQLLNLAAHSEAQERAGDGARPWDLIGKKVESGFRELVDLPGYLDLPAYDAVRELGVSSTVYQGIPFSKRALVLCPYAETYSARNWNRFLNAELPAMLKQLARSHKNEDAKPRLERLLDFNTPRLVAQTLFGSIRLMDLCFIDWTGMRPNVMFEAGVRLATHALGAVHIVEESAELELQIPSEHPQQREALLRLFQPIRYRCKVDHLEPFRQMIKRFEEDLRDSRDRRNKLVYLAVGNSIDYEAQPVALPLETDLIRSANILASDDSDSSGLSPVLYHQVNDKLVEQAQSSAAHRRLAAWLFLDEMFSIEQIAGDSERAAQFELLSAQVRRWARKAGRKELIDRISAKTKALQRAPRGEES